MSRAPPPKSAPVISKEAVDIVKRKLAPPAGPPPAGMTINFSAPKKYSKLPSPDAQYKRGKNNYVEEEEDFDDDDNNDDYDENFENRHNNLNRDYDRRNYERNMKSRGNGQRRNTEDPDRHSYDEDAERDYNSGEEDRNYSDNDHDDDEEEYDDYRDSNKRNHSKKSKTERNNYDYDDQAEENEEGSFEWRAGNHAKDKGNENNYIVNKPVNEKTVDSVADSKNPQPNASDQVSYKTLSGEKVTDVRSSNNGKFVGFNFQPILRSTYRELKQFVTSPAPPMTTIKCYVERNRSGSKMLAPFFSLCADLEDGTGRELMVCRKVMRSRSSHYVFSLKAEDLWRKREQRSRLYLGKLRAINSNQYVLYDNGICAAPDDPNALLEEDDGQSAAQTSGANLAPGEDVSLYRKELAVIHFNSKHRPAPKGVRGMEVAIAATGSTSNSSGSNTFNITKAFDRARETGKQNTSYTRICTILHEKSTRYDPLSSCIVDYKGRAHMASVKNFQLLLSDPMCELTGNSGAESKADLSNLQEKMMKRDSEKEFVMQMGKTTEDCFNMDFRAPLSLLQAFAICIARFDAKLNW